MTELFIKILNVSISACWLILAVVCLRFVLKKAPKWVRGLLWGLVAVRLLCPFSIESAFSLIPSAETISPEIMLDNSPTVATGIATIDAVVNPVIIQSSVPDPVNSVNPLQIWLAVAGVIWVLGITVMLAYTVISYILLRRKVATAVKIREGLYQSENVVSAFVLGIFRPRIYLPFHLSQQSLSHVIAHEQAHIHRKDHWWKPLGFLLLTLHWFNPMMWLAYVLLCRDIELACDEKVIKLLDTDARADYSAALLSCSVSHRMIAACPIAFGEVSVKTRIKSVLSYKKPAFWVILIALVLCVVVAVCFLTNPIDSSGEPDLSFLNYKNAIPLVADREEVQVIYYPADKDETESFIKIGHIAGADLAAYLDNCRWREVKSPMDTLSSPGSVEFVIEDEYRITVHDRKDLSARRYVKVSYQDEVRYYAARRADYSTAVSLLEIYLENDEAVADAQFYSYSLMIGEEGVTKIQVTTPNGTEVQRNTLGLSYEKGQEVQLKALDGISDLRGVSITAMDRYGEILYGFSVPEGATNAEIINMVGADGWLLAPTVAIGSEDGGQYYHIISAEGVVELKFSGVNFGGGSVHADGSPFSYGERVWLEPMDGFTDLEDVTVTALDKDGNVLYGFLLVPNRTKNEETEVKTVSNTDPQKNEETEVKTITNADPQWSDGVVFKDLGPNEEQTSDFEISLVNDLNTVQYSITWARTGLTLEYGLRSSDGTEYFCGHEGGSGNGQFEKIPAGIYRLFVRNTDYTDVPAYENPTVFPYISFKATGVMNFRIP